MKSATTKTPRHEGDRKPDLILCFAKGNYHDALLAYQECKGFVLHNGIAYDTRLVGVINSPSYKGQKVEGGFIPGDWKLTDLEWQTTIDFWTNDPAALVRLKKLPLPAKAAWIQNEVL